MNAVRARHLIDELTDALREGELGLKTVPGLMRAVLKEGAWRERQVRTGKVVTFERFADFVTTPPLDGLGESPDLIKRILHDDPEALVLFETAMVGPHGGDRKSKADNVSLEPAHGNSAAYTLRRLARDRPDLFEQVAAGAMTANRAAIEAGFRRVKTPLDQMKGLWAKLDHEARAAFIAFAAASS